MLGQATSLPLVDTVYTVSVTATNFLGGVSNAATLSIVKRVVPPPLLFVLMPSAPLYNQDTIVIEGSASFSKCVLSKLPLNFEWAVSTSASFASTVPELTSSSAKLTIPPGTLAPGTTYYVRLVATLPGAGQAEEVRTLIIQQSPLVAKISGGDSMLASLTVPVTVDASQSFDPDLCEPAQKGELQEACPDASLKFSWSCTTMDGAFCRRAADDALFELSDQATANVDLPLLRDTLTSIVISVIVSKGSRSSSSSVRIQLTKERVLRVSIEVLKASSDRLVLRNPESASSDGGGAKCAWSLAGGDLPASVDKRLASYYSDVEFVSTGWEASTFSMLLQSYSASQVLTPGATYSLTLSCTSAQGVSGRATYSWRVRVPPWGGACRVTSPKVAVALVDLVTITCSSWSGEVLPISYSFGMGRWAPGASYAPEMSFSISGMASVGSFKLPEGNYTAIVRVCDASDTCSSSSPENVTVVAVVPAPGKTEESTVASCVNDMASLAQSSSLLTASDSIVASMNADTCSASGTCSPARRRLLASSAAYRMRVRRLLMTKMAGGSVAAEMSTSAPRALKSVKKLSGSPQEVRPEAGDAMLSMLMSGSANMFADQLRNGGGLANIVELCHSTFLAADYMVNVAARDRLLLGTKESMQNVASVYVSSMTSDEQVYIVTQPTAGLLLKRQNRQATSFTSPHFYGSVVEYAHGMVQSVEATSRRQQAADGPGIYVTYFARVWQPRNTTLDMSGVIGVSMVTSAGAIAPPLPPASELHASRKCATPGCVRIWLQFKVPPETLSAENSTREHMAYFLRGVQCMHWGRDSWELDKCTLPGNISYNAANNSNFVSILCECVEDGFVYADWRRPPSPPHYTLVVTYHVGHSCLWQAIAFIAAMGCFAAILAAVVYRVSARYALMWGVRYFSILDTVKAHAWLEDTPVRALEHLWINMLGFEDTKKAVGGEGVDMQKLEADMKGLFGNMDHESFWRGRKTSSAGSSGVPCKERQRVLVSPRHSKGRAQNVTQMRESGDANALPSGPTRFVPLVFVLKLCKHACFCIAVL